MLEYRRRRRILQSWIMGGNRAEPKTLCNVLHGYPVPRICSITTELDTYPHFGNNHDHRWLGRDMKRFTFSLERVLSFKRQAERMAELMELKARVVRQNAQQEVDELKEDLARLATEMSVATGPAGQKGNWAGKFEQSAALGRSLDAATKVLEEATRVHLDSIRERARWATEVEALRTIRRNHWEAFRLEAQRDGQVRLDELGLRNWTPPEEGTSSEAL